MAVTQSPRMNLPLWGAGSDPFTRQQMLSAMQAIESRAAYDLQVATANDLPATGAGVGIRGRYCMALDTGVLFRDTGTAWVQVNTSQASYQADLAATTATVVHDGPTNATDANTLTTKNGLHYFTSTGHSNLPSGIGSLVAVEVKRLDSSTVVQTAYSVLTPRVRWHRYLSGGSWSTWKTVGLSDLAPPTQSLNLGGFNITGVADPVNAQDVATKAWVQANMGGNWSAWTTFTPTQGVSPLNASMYFDVATKFPDVPLSRYRTRGDEVDLWVSARYVATSTLGPDLFSPSLLNPSSQGWVNGLPSAIRPATPISGGYIAGSSVSQTQEGFSIYSRQNVYQALTGSTPALTSLKTCSSLYYSPPDYGSNINANSIITPDGKIYAGFNMPTPVMTSTSSIPPTTEVAVAMNFKYRLP